MSKRTGPIGELVLYLKHHKAYWLAPIILVLILLAILLIFGGTGEAPFIYTFF
jgi:hypothetical protein